MVKGHVLVNSEGRRSTEEEKEDGVEQWIGEAKREIEMETSRTSTGCVERITMVVDDGRRPLCEDNRRKRNT